MVDKMTLKEIRNSTAKSIKYLRNQGYSNIEILELQNTGRTLGNLALKVGLKKNKKGETLGHRSTSVGDIIIIKWKSDIRLYQCSVVGWKLIDIMEFLKIMGYSRTDCRDYVSDLYREKEIA